MNILFLTRLYYPHIGGVEKHVGEVGKRLIKKGYKVTIVTELLGETKREEIRDGIKIIRFAYPKVKFLGLIFIWLQLLRRFQLIKTSDILHVHDVFVWYLPFKFLFPQKSVYVTFHGWEGKYPVPWSNKFLRKVAEKLSWGNICVGDYLKKWYGTNPTFVTYGGINIIQNLKVLAKFKIVFIGRLTGESGLVTYLKTLKLLKFPHDQIVFLGDGPLRDEANKFGQVCGFIENINPYLSNSRFVIALGFLSILEGMAARKLIFSVYNNPLRQDYLKMAPFARWIVAESSPKKLAEKVEYYLKHPEEEKKLVEEGYNWIQQQTWDKVVEIYLRLWRFQ